MTRVLITGVAGFIGSNLAQALIDRRYEVIGVDDLSQGTLENVPEGTQFHALDLRDDGIAPLFQGVDTVFHLAAKNCLPECLAHPVETSEINVGGTVKALEHARRSRVRKFIYADTSAEYEGTTAFPSTVERVCPISPYAVSKRSGALFCESYSRMFGITITILRYFNVYGPAQDWRRVIPPVMSAFILRLLRGEPPIVYGTGQKRRDFVYVDDVNRFHLMTMTDSRTDGRTFNVGSSVNYSILEVYEMIERILSTGIAPVHKPELPGDVDTTLADISDSIALGWKPKVDIKEGLQRSVEYIRRRVFPAPASCA